MVHAFFRFCFFEQACGGFYPLTLTQAVQTLRCWANRRPQRKRTLRRPVHLHLPITVLASLNVALKISGCLFREPIYNGDTPGLRCNQGIQFIVLKMSVEWPSQTELLLLIRLRSEKSFFSVRRLRIDLNLHTDHPLAYQPDDADKHALDALWREPDCRQRRNVFRSHSLLVIEPKNCAIALSIRPFQARLDTPIDLLEQNFAFYCLLSTGPTWARFWIGALTELTDFA
jgi:hypothetical protein